MVDLERAEKRKAARMEDFVAGIKARGGNSAEGHAGGNWVP